MSRSMYLYFGSHVLFGSQCIPYYAYICIYSKPFATYTLWWFGMPNSAYSALAPYPTVFLVLDRCLVLWSATTLTQKTTATLRNILLCVGVVAVCSLYVGTIVGNILLEFPLNPAKLRTCGTVACLVSKTNDLLMITTRFVGEVCSMCASILFFSTLHFQQGGSRAKSVVRYWDMHA